MSQHDFDIANQGFAAFRADLNNALKALGSVSSGTEAPTTTYANQLWYETDTNTLHIRNEANSAWLDLMVIDQTTGSPSFNAGNVGIGTVSPDRPLKVEGSVDGRFTAAAFYNNINSTNTATSIELLDRNVVTGGTSAVRLSSNREAALNSFAFSVETASAGTYTERMRIDSSGNVGIGTSSPADVLDVAAAADGGIRLTDSTNEARFCQITQSAARLTLSADPTNAVATSFINFLVDGTERARIDSSGNLLVGTTGTPSGAANGVMLSASGQGIFSKSAAASLLLYRPDSNGNIAEFYKGSTNVGSISVTGTATAYNTSSDYRLKEDVQPMVGASDRVLSLNPVNFAWKADGSRTDGFIAHEVQVVAPQAVTGVKDGEQMQGMDHSKLVPLLTAALQEALTKIEALEARITALEA